MKAIYFCALFSYPTYKDFNYEEVMEKIREEIKIFGI